MGIRREIEITCHSLSFRILSSRKFEVCDNFASLKHTMLSSEVIYIAFGVSENDSELMDVTISNDVPNAMRNVL